MNYLENMCRKKVSVQLTRFFYYYFISGGGTVNGNGRFGGDSGGGGAAYYNERSAGARRVYKVIIDLCHGTAALLKFDQTQE